MRTYCIAVLAMLVVFPFCTSASAATYQVIQDGRPFFSSIQDAVDVAVDGDTVIVHPGTYNESISFSGKNIVVRSTDPTDWFVVQATTISAPEGHATVMFDGGEQSACELSGLTITKEAGADDAGGVGGKSTDLSPHTKATISHCLVVGNVGGIYACDGTITDCLIIENDFTGVDQCNGVIKNCVVALGTYGGLRYCNGEIFNCLVVGNYFADYGAGLYRCNGNIVNCTVAYNGESYEGAGLYECNGTIRNCIIWGNEGWGGGSYLSDNVYGDVRPQDSWWDEADPLFATGPSILAGLGPEPDYYMGVIRGFYLSSRAAGQAEDSPCIDFGSGTAEEWGLQDRTTRTDEVPDAGRVDIGYHYPARERIIECSLNSDSFLPGDLLVGSLRKIENKGSDIQLDVYVGFVLPDGTVLYFTDSGFTTLRARWRPAFLPEGFVVGETEVLSFSVPPGTAPGSYLFAAALAPRGEDTFLSVSLAEFHIETQR